MPHIDDITPEGDVEKAVKNTTCKSVPHRHKHASENGDIPCICDHNRLKSERTDKIRENRQGAISLTGSHAVTCFKKDANQDTPEVAEEIKSMVDDAPLEGSS